jgi:hypothetical protein
MTEIAPTRIEIGGAKMGGGGGVHVHLSWLADVCAAEGMPFGGHARAMKAIHGGKAKNDPLDSFKIATLLRGGLLSQAYVYPAAMRATRDLLRRRLHLVRKRGQLLAHIQNTGGLIEHRSRCHRPDGRQNTHVVWTAL